MKNGDIIEIEITDVTNEAMGVGHFDGMAVFVPGAVRGDVLSVQITKLKKTYAYGRIKNIISKSVNRCKAQCAAYKMCGGCQLMHMTYDEQIEIKKQFIFNSLSRLGGFENLPELEMIPSDNAFGYRNKMVFPVGTSGRKTVCGFYKIKSHDIVPLGFCPLGINSGEKIISALLKYMSECGEKAYDEKTHSGAIRRLFIRSAVKTGETMAVISANADCLKNEKRLCELLKKADSSIKSVILNINKEKTNLVLGGENRVLSGRAVIKEQHCGFDYEISPNSFFQVNPTQTEKLYNKAIEFADIKKSDNVLDLYCGIGTISLAASRYAKSVSGIEIVPDAIENARENAENNGVENCSFYVGDAQTVVPKLIGSGIAPDKVILDPPRKGSDEITLKSICSAGPEKIVYVSCNPATLARDLKFLGENGYKINRVCGVDMFPNTVHVETVCLMSRICSGE